MSITFYLLFIRKNEKNTRLNEKNFTKRSTNIKSFIQGNLAMA